MFPIQSCVPHRSAPFVTWSLIVINVAVFLYQVNLPAPELDRFLVDYALIPGRYSVHLPFLPAPTLADYLPFVTNIFLHGGWLHLILNMWTLFLFGPAVEDRMGGTRYLLFYSICGIAASIAHAYVNATSFVPALGASGAIAGVIGAFVRLFPLANVIVVIPIFFFPFFFEVPALLFAGLWFLMQFVQGTIELVSLSTGSGIAWWAHVGGFAAGVLLTSVLARPEHTYRRYYLDEGIYGFLPNGRR